MYILKIYIVYSQNKFLVSYMNVDCFVNFALDFIPPYMFQHMVLAILPGEDEECL
jgi:hypothetical protein